MNWTETTVSMVQNVTDQQPKPVKLGDWLRAMKVSNIDHIHKKNRPALMPHGQFRGGRSALHLWRESGLMQFDIDTKHNPGLCADTIKRRAAQMPEVVLCAVSAGGGVWGLVLRGDNETDQLQRLSDTLRVTLDTANSRNVAALRFASHDAQPHIKHTT
jgi:hypothetical protein